MGLEMLLDFILMGMGREGEVGAVSVERRQ
jgi:hypothetical protein